MQKNYLRSLYVAPTERGCRCRSGLNMFRKGKPIKRNKKYNHSGCPAATLSCKGAAKRFDADPGVRSIRLQRVGENTLNYAKNVVSTDCVCKKLTYLSFSRRSSDYLLRICLSISKFSFLAYILPSPTTAAPRLCSSDIYLGIFCI